MNDELGAQIVRDITQLSLHAASLEGIDRARLCYLVDDAEWNALGAWDYEPVVRRKEPGETEVVALRIAGIEVRRR